VDKPAEFVESGLIISNNCFVAQRQKKITKS